MVMTKIEIEDPEYFSKTMILLLVSFMMLLMREHLSKSRTLRWLMRLGRSLEESFEGTKAIKGCKDIHFQGEVCWLQVEGK